MQLHNTYFEKVSLLQWESASSDNTADGYEDIVLPRRMTEGSAGYDFSLPLDIDIPSGKTVKVATGVRSVIEDGCVLVIAPRSSLGFKYGLALSNTVAIVDSDYSKADNEGHIFLSLVNRGDKDLHFEKGTRIAQGIFLPYGTVCGDDVSAKRTGGIGSTD